MEHEIRPWGECWVLEDTTKHKVTRVSVNPKGCLSYQCQDHHEIWIMISAGIGRIISNGIEKNYKIGDSAIIPKGVKYSIENPFAEPLLFIEVRHGTYFWEEDIVRIEDDYRSS